MKNNMKPCVLLRVFALGLVAALCAAVLLWALRVRFDDPLTASLTPIFGSPWEMGKSAFFPLLAASPLMWRVGRGGSRSGLCAMAIAGSLMATGFALLGVSQPLTALLAITAAAILYAAVLYRLRERAKWFASVLILTALYLILTLLRPDGVLFSPLELPASTLPF